MNFTNTYLSNTIELTDKKARYDNCAKAIMADKQVLARIAKHTTKEFKGYDIPTIIQCIEGNPEISTIPMYSGSVVKTKIQDFYNELIWLISYEEHGENSGTLPRTIYAKLHTATASLDSSIQPVSDNQVQNDAVQSYRCGYIDQWQLWLL